MKFCGAGPAGASGTIGAWFTSGFAKSHTPFVGGHWLATFAVPALDD